MDSLKKADLATFSFTWWTSRTSIHGLLGAGWRIVSTWFISSVLVPAQEGQGWQHHKLELLDNSL